MAFLSKRVLMHTKKELCFVKRTDEKKTHTTLISKQKKKYIKKRKKYRHGNLVGSFEENKK